MTDGPGEPTRASTFVTVLAWIVISFTGLGAGSMLLQIVIWNILFTLPDMHPKATTGDQAFIVMRVLMVILFGFLVFALVTGIAFLKRRDWARRAFIALFALAIGLNLLSFIPFLIAGLFSGSASTSGPAQFQTMVRVMIIPVGISAISMSVLFGWLIRRLRSSDVRREFLGGVAA